MLTNNVFVLLEKARQVLKIIINKKENMPT